MEPENVKFSNLSPWMQGVACLFTIVSIVVPSVLGFVSFDKRIDIVEVEQDRHVTHSDKKFDNAEEDIETNEDSIHSLELVDKGLTVQYQEILRRQGEMLSEIKNLARVD